MKRTVSFGKPSQELAHAVNWPRDQNKPFARGVGVGGDAHAKLGVFRRRQEGGCPCHPVPFASSVKAK